MADERNDGAHVTMNAEIYRARIWPLASDSYVILTWNEPHPGELILEWYMIPDDDEEKGFDARRHRVKGDQPPVPGHDTGLESWIDHLKHLARSEVQSRVDEAWLEKGIGGFPPDVALERVEPLSLLGLRFRGRGQTGLEVIRDKAGDADLRRFAAGLLGVRPWRREDILGEGN